MGGHMLDEISGSKFPMLPNSIGRGNLHMEIPWTGPNLKWKFHGKA
jgi:hypothetical protein